MPDREKVIRSIDRCVIKRGKCHECDYYTQTEQEMSCRNRLLMDALAILKEQNGCENCAIAIEDRQSVVRCKDCRKHGDTDCPLWTDAVEWETDDE